MFFEQERSQFFRPLTGKYREQVVEVLRELYKQLYSSSYAGSSDYGQALSRDAILGIFLEALVRAPILQVDSDEYDSDDQNSGESDNENRFKTHR